MRKKERPCGRAGCEKSCRTGGRYCRACCAAASRRSHARHRRERNARRRDRAAERDALARMRDSARAKLYVAIARGKMEKGSCAVCGCGEVTAFIVDPARWWEAIWLCREDRHEEIVRRLAVSHPPAQAAVHSAYRIGQTLWNGFFDSVMLGFAFFYHTTFGHPTRNTQASFSQKSTTLLAGWNQAPVGPPEPTVSVMSYPTIHHVSHDLGNNRKHA
jgi:hypothetical protein